MSARRPDTTVTASVYLTCDEIGKAFANRGDDDQVEILKAIAKGFDNWQQAELQASYIGSRLFREAGSREGENAIGFLRQILYSCRHDARKVEQLATVPGEPKDGE